MANIFSRVCNACNGQHVLIIVDADMPEEGAEYEYVCPTTKKSVQFTTSDWGQVIQNRPKNTVTVKKVRSRE